jgi:hypothetical protein
MIIVLSMALCNFTKISSLLPLFCTMGFRVDHNMCKHFANLILACTKKLKAKNKILGLCIMAIIVLTFEWVLNVFTTKISITVFTDVFAFVLTWMLWVISYYEANTTMFTCLSFECKRAFIPGKLSCNIIICSRIYVWLTTFDLHVKVLW